jgi:hypothetical protein
MEKLVAKMLLRGVLGRASLGSRTFYNAKTIKIIVGFSAEAAMIPIRGSSLVI